MSSIPFDPTAGLWVLAFIGGAILAVMLHASAAASELGVRNGLAMVAVTAGVIWFVTGILVGLARAVIGW